MDSQTPEDLFQQVTALKSMKSGLGVGLEVWISIGGWTFSNNGTDTQAVFGNIARSADNRQKFADNLVQFMTRYGFDGADLDWYVELAWAKVESGSLTKLGSTPVLAIEEARRTILRTSFSSSGH